MRFALLCAVIVLALAAAVVAWPVKSTSYTISGVIADAGMDVSGSYNTTLTLGQPVIGIIGSSGYSGCLGWLCEFWGMKWYNISFSGRVAEDGIILNNSRITITITNVTQYSLTDTTDNNGDFSITFRGIPENFINAGFETTFYAEGMKVNAEYECNVSWNEAIKSYECK